MTGKRLHCWVASVLCLLLLSSIGRDTAFAADPYGSLSESILGNQLSGPYKIGMAGATFVNDSAFVVQVEVDGSPAPEGTTVSFLLAPETDVSRRQGFGSGAAVVDFTPEQEQKAIAAVAESPGVWVLNPAPLTEDGSWKGRLLIDGPAGAATVGFSFHVYPPRPIWSPLATMAQPFIPIAALGLALLVVRTLRKPLLRASPVAAPVPEGG